jgi:hypothetical protein
MQRLALPRLLLFGTVSFLFVIFLRGLGVLLAIALAFALHDLTTKKIRTNWNAGKIVFGGSFAVTSLSLLVSLVRADELINNKSLLPLVDLAYVRSPMDRIMLVLAGASGDEFQKLSERLSRIPDGGLRLFPPIFISILAGALWFSVSLPYIVAMDILKPVQ